MRRIMVSAAAVALLAACHPAPLGHARGAPDRPVSVASTLDCPDTQGDLTLSRRASDGASCSYAGPDGAQVTLTRMALTGGSAQATLAALDAQARALAPDAPDEAAQASSTTTTVSDGATGSRSTTRTTVSTSSTHESDGDDDTPAPPTPPAPSTPPRSGEHVRLDLPGLHIDADDGHARVSGFGQHVEADEGGAVVHGDVAGTRSSVIANDHGATVRTGGAGSRSVDASLILASDTAGPGGWRSAGYVARGPLAGPLVVAQVQARGRSHGDGEGPFGAAHRLVDRNTRR